VNRENEEGALARRPHHDHLSQRPEITIRTSRLTALQDWLITASTMLGDARDELTSEQWRAFIWILCDRIGEEAARLIVLEAFEATEEAA
jgi:hypothetical protein